MSRAVPARWGIALILVSAGCSGAPGNTSQGKTSGSPDSPGGSTGDGVDSGRDAAGESLGDAGGAVDAGGESTAPTDGAPGSPPIDGAAPMGGMLAGVDVHNYPEPDAYGFTSASGTDRMGAALKSLGDTAVRGATIGDTTFLTRLAGFGVKEVVLGLSATAYGKPFDATMLATALAASAAAAKSAGITVYVEGLNEWDLFNTKSYNAGAVPQGTTESGFILFTQKALYEAAHPLGITVLGPSVGHPSDATSLAFFPDVSAYVDVVNAHIYFTTEPESLALPALVQAHQVIEGAGKPLWVTETGVSSYGSVTAQSQADIIGRGLAAFATSKLIARAFLYELLDENVAGLSGSTYTADSDQIHFGLFDYTGAAKPAATPVRTFIASQ